MTKIITRFAPSPTGDLHIGGARTALFNYLAAKHAGGEFHLRIEDTDQDRNKEESLKSILDGLEWLGIKHDGEIVHQSSRVQRHADVARELVARGQAYYCYMTQAELNDEKAKADLEKRPFKYDRRWRTPDGFTAPLYKPEKNPVIRLKMPLEGRSEFTDIVRETISVPYSELEDFVIVRSDGTPTYLLAVVVDDYDSGITHVIRGEDHISNTHKQIQIYKALEWNLPEFAHIPLIHGEDGKKLSKRHGAGSVLAWRDAGYLPEAVCSYLVGLGWGHATPYMTMDEMIEKFDIHQVGSSPSRLDQKKLDNINFHFLQNRDDEYLLMEIMNRHASDPENFFYNQQNGPYRVAVVTERLTKMMPELKPRAKTLVELYLSAKFLYELPPYDPSAKLFLQQNIGTLHTFLSDFARTEISLSDFAEKQNLKVRDVSIVLRAAMCGSKTSSGSMGSIMKALGRAEVMARMRAALDYFSPHAG